MRPATTAVTIFLVTISIGHFLRVIFQVKVIANGVTIPIWLSILACIVTAVLAFLLWRENRKINYLKKFPVRKK
jgi:hypothetical protein